MISVAEARQLITQHIITLPAEMLPLSAAFNRVLAKAVYSNTSIPPFKQAGMDGYAFKFTDYTIGRALEIVDEVAAGSNTGVQLLHGQAVRIFTGAPVPETADTIVMQEKTRVENGQLSITDESILQGNNVRTPGSDIMKGQIAMESGTLLTPAAIGLLCGIGETEVTVYSQPAVAIIVTGNELQKQGKPLQPGQIYESNGSMLSAALQELHISKVSIYSAPDNLVELQAILQNALQQVDMVLLCGGVSVGDYDFVVEATRLCGVQKIFHKIKQRPGKPIFFGVTEKQLVFGLPGNPSAVLSCFYEYVMQAIQQMQGNTSPGLVKAFLPLSQQYKKNTSLTHFLKASCDGKKVTLLGAQESYKLNSFATANCLALIPEEVSSLEEGDLVEVHFVK